MESWNGDAFYIKVWSHNRNKNISSSGRSKSRGRSKSIGKPIKVCWKYGKEGHFKKHCRSKYFEKRKGSIDAPSTDVKTISDEGEDVYLDSY